MKIKSISGVFPNINPGQRLPKPPCRVTCGECTKVYVYQNLSFAGGMRAFWSALIYRGWEVIGGFNGTLPSYRCPECKSNDEPK